MKAIYPGSFDPITYGHLDIISRAAKMYDKLYIAVAKNISKQYLFSSRERFLMVKKSIAHLENVEVVEIEGLIVEYALRNNIEVMVRGLRVVSDFEHELQIAITNRVLSDKIETVFLMSDHKHSFLSSSQARELAKFNGDLSLFVPDHIARELRKKYA